MNHIVLYKPEIPPNTGNIARTCAGTDTHLHLIYPLGFSLEDKMLKRAGLDYWNELKITYHENLDAFLEYAQGANIYLVTKFAHHTYTQFDYSDTKSDHFFLFGNETAGLPEEFMRQNKEKCIRIPMDDTHVRSLNLANTAAIIIYETLRQQNFSNLNLMTHYTHDKLD